MHRTGGLMGGLSTGPTLLTVGLIGLGGYALYKFLGGRGLGGTRVGAVDCGPSAYWDDVTQNCVPVAVPFPTTSPVPVCPPGSFFDYFKQQCVTMTPAPAVGYRGNWNSNANLPPAMRYPGGHHHHRRNNAFPAYPQTAMPRTMPQGVMPQQQQMMMPQQPMMSPDGDYDGGDYGGDFDGDGGDY